MTDTSVRMRSVVVTVARECIDTPGGRSFIDAAVVNSVDVSDIIEVVTS